MNRATEDGYATNDGITLRRTGWFSPRKPIESALYPNVIPVSMLPTHRPRRNRKSAVIRDMVQETRLTAHDFIYPLFITEGHNQTEEIKSMPGIMRFTADRVIDEIGQCVELGVKAFAPFPNINEVLKDPMARESTNLEGLYLKAVADIKRQFPEVVIMTDVAMDPYSSDGHDGVVDPDSGEILNDASLEVLGQMALAQARAGPTSSARVT